MKVCKTTYEVAISPNELLSLLSEHCIIPETARELEVECEYSECDDDTIVLRVSFTDI